MTALLHRRDQNEHADQKVYFRQEAARQTIIAN